MDKQLERPQEKKMLGGVCAGIADYFNIDPTLVRVGAVALTVASAGTAVPLAYGLGWALMPEKGTGRVPFQDFVKTAEHKAQEASNDLQRRADEMGQPTAQATDPVEPIKVNDQPAPWEQPYDPSKVTDRRDADGMNL